MSTHDILAVDAACNLFTPEVVATRPAWTREFIGGKVKAADKVEGVTVAEMLAMMDRAGVEKALLLAPKLGSPGHPANWQLPYEWVARVVEQYPGRFYGVAGIDPSEGMAGVRKLEHAVKELGFVGAHLYPHWFEMAPDHRKYYPFYAKCVELDVPIQMQVGHCLRYSAERPLRSVGQPITLDTVACDFPDLKLIGSHVGWPWTEEMISVAYKHPNVYIITDAYAPKHWSPSQVHFINTVGQDKAMFGTDFPVIDIERDRREVEEFGLRPEPKRKFLRDNVIRVYKLDGA
ncbi:MAG: amidohydrolase [Chloroflexi bacterium]|nr:amidohydrolase [Chloroflexota bacterium]